MVYTVVAVKTGLVAVRKCGPTAAAVLLLDLTGEIHLRMLFHNRLKLLLIIE